MDSRHPFLRVRDHFAEQVGETGSAEFGGAGAVQVAVVDGFAVRWGAEAGRGGEAVDGGGAWRGEGPLLLLLLELGGLMREGLEVMGGGGGHHAFVFWVGLMEESRG